ncbi:MAG: endonuclease/exonuclease/phosphatase family protein [bacterium]|nr:endonuclease/exonuclease/phosphatase family protein [bacterium]
MKAFKTAIKVFLFFLLGLCLGLALFLIYASNEGISPSKLPRKALVSYPVPEQPVPTSMSEGIKVISFNMGYAYGEANNRGRILTREEVEKNLGDMIQKLKNLQADILLLQEVDFFARRSFDTNQMAALAQGLGLPYGAYVLTWNKKYIAWPYWPLNRHFGRMVSGQAVLSRFPINKQEILAFEKPRDNPFWYNWFYLNRLAQRLVINIGESTLEVYNVHLEAFSKGTNQNQLMDFARWISGSPHPIKIVGGDFNLDWELEPERKRLQAFGTVANLEMAQPDSGDLTYPSWEPQKRIDFIFYSPNWSEVESGVLTGLLASDHLAVWARLRL